MRRLISMIAAIAICCSTTTAQVQLPGAEKANLDGVTENFPQPTPLKNVTFERPEINNEIRYKPNTKFSRTIYVDPQKGKDSNSGLSTKTPIKTLEQLAKMKINFSDQILLKGGEIHKGMVDIVNLNKATQSKSKIHVSSYGAGKATIDFKGYPAGVWIQNTSNVIVSDLKMTGDGGPDNPTFMYNPNEKRTKQRYGVRMESNGSSEYSLMKNLVVYNVDIENVYLINPVKISRACRQWDMNDGAGWGWGVYGEVTGSPKGGKGKGIHGVEVKFVTVQNVSQMGIRFKGRGGIDGALASNTDDIRIENCTVFQSGGPGMQFSCCNNSYMKYCRITQSGDRNDNRKWGRGSGMWTWGVNNFLLEYNIFEGAMGIADCCGAHIDFNCSNVVIQYSLSRYNCGGFIEVLGKNSNCSYRYNVSVNDGWRNLREDKEQHFWGKVGTPGHVVTVNGHNNKKKYVGPFNTYIYNNTIITTKEGMAPFTSPNVFNISTSNEGLVMMNNIFWFEEKTNRGWSMHRWLDGAPYDAAFDFKVSDAPNPKAKPDPKMENSRNASSRPMNASELDKLNLVMRNNVYRLSNPQGKDKFETVANALPEGYWDERARSERPMFVNEKGDKAADFVPTNAELINTGEPIKKLKSDKSKEGIIFGGLKMTTDFFGNKIEGDIIGAIVPNAKIRDWSRVIPKE